MTLFTKPLLFAVFFSLLAFGCSPKCEETSQTCLDHHTIKLCVKGAAPSEQACGDGLVCDAVACGSGGDCCVAGKVCAETVSQCLDPKTVERCTASEVARTEICADGLVCDAVACGSGGDCCVAGKVCTATANQCLDLKTVERCTASEVARTEICADGLVCDPVACGSGGDCCVASKICEESSVQCLNRLTAEICLKNASAKIEICAKGFHCDVDSCAKGKDCCLPSWTCQASTRECLDLKTAEICVKGQRAELEICGESAHCDAAACASGGDCCVPGKVCTETHNQCLDLKTAEHCSASEAVKTEVCGDGFVCDSEACVSGDDCCVAGKVCSATSNQCIDHKTIERCTASELARTEACGDGFVCDSEACASGGDCCVAGKLCTETAKQCLNLKTVEHCTASEVARTETCGKVFYCDAEACASGGDCCVTNIICPKTGKQCLDLRTAEVCVQDARAELELCGEGAHCDAQACASGPNCCVAGKVCDQTLNTCLDEDRLEICVADQRPIEQVCGSGKKCDRGNCVPATCANKRLDKGENAVDCGGACAPCVACRVHADCGTDGFCDSASGYVCSKRCRTNNDCDNNEAWDGNYCRGDGRCSPKVFETVWELKLAGPTDEEPKQQDPDDEDDEVDTTSVWELAVIDTEEDERIVDEPTVVLPFDPKYPNAKCDFQILWGDEPENTDITALAHVTDCTKLENRTHEYAGSGRYHVKIIGTYDGWGAFDLINEDGQGPESSAPALASKLRAVISFGPVGLSSGAFYGASHLREMPAKDCPDASKLKSLASAFNKAYKFDASIGHWDTSQVKDMSAMFSDAARFNQPLGSWDTSQVRNMYQMFSTYRGMYRFGYRFDQPIGAWDTSKVTNMAQMFGGATSFNQPIGSWDTSKVRDMNRMFNGASRFNQAIGAWNTSKVTNMSGMFALGSMEDDMAFNQAVGGWDTSNVMDMSVMFWRNEAFNQDLSKWILKEGVKLEDIFDGAIDAVNLCLLRAKGGAWLDVPEVNGATCK